MESNISAKEQLMKSEDDKLREHIDKVEADNVKQDEKIEKLDGRIDQLKDNHTSHSEILEAILKELKEKDKVSGFGSVRQLFTFNEFPLQTIEEMNNQLDILMKERDGGNDAITDAFDAKIKKVYETVELKANAERLEEVFKTSSEEIATVKSNFEDRVSAVDKKHAEMDSILAEIGTKIETIDTAAKETKVETKSTTDSLETKQEAFKQEMGQMKQLHTESDTARIEETNKINTQVIPDIIRNLIYSYFQISDMLEKQNVLSSNFTKLDTTVRK